MSLFHTEGTQLHYLEQIDFPKLGQHSKAYLDSLFEVKVAMRKLGAWKALGPDGVHIGFYCDNWELVGPFITQKKLQNLSN